MSLWADWTNRILGHRCRVWYVVISGLLICACNPDYDSHIGPGDVILPASDSTDGTSDNDDIVLGFQPDPPATASCTDGILNGDETDIDCGGTCEPCEIGQGCTDSSDCAGGSCTNGVCQGAPVWTGPAVVPWLDLGDRTIFETAVEGLRIWARITDTAVVQVSPAHTDLLRELRERVPEINYIPGVKTTPLWMPAGLDSVEGWREIAKAVAELRDYTGSQFVLLEAETAVKPYAVDNTYQPDWEKCKAGLATLPSDVTYLWWPCTSADVVKMRRYVELCSCIESVCSVVFIDGVSLQSPQYYGITQALQAAAALREVASQPPVPQIICYPETHWPYERVPEAIALADCDWVLLYPGRPRWVEAASSVTQYLLEQMSRDSQ